MLLLVACSSPNDQGGDAANPGDSGPAGGASAAGSGGAGGPAGPGDSGLAGDGGSGGAAGNGLESGVAGSADGGRATGGAGGSAGGGAGSTGTPPPDAAEAGGSMASPPDAAEAGAAPGADAEAVSDAGRPDTTVNGTGPGDWGPGDYPPDINAATYLEITGIPGQNGYMRQYKVHVPPSYDPQVPSPLVFCVHGLMQDALMFCVVGAQMHLKSDEAGFILVMPNGYQNSWNAGTCCGGASAEQLDDVALFRRLVREVGEHVNIDLGRIYATGLSNGGFMSFRLGCEAADVFAAIAPAAGSIGTNDMGWGTNPASDFATCEPSDTMPVLEIHGTGDMLVPYTLQQPSLDYMAASNGCSTTTAPASLPASGGDTTCVTYTDCPPGVEVTGCSVENGGHCWFGSADCGTGGGAIGLAVVGANSDTMDNNDAAWEFLSRFSR